MIYFKKIVLHDRSQAELEAALRKVSMKSQSSFGLSGSSTNVGSKYAFIGYEGKNELLFTRIKYFVEQYLPQIVVKISQDPGEAYYQLRLGIRTTIVFALVSLFGLLLIITSLRNTDNIGQLLPMFLILACFYFLILLEVKLTVRQIDKALKKYKELKVVDSSAASA